MYLLILFVISSEIDSMTPFTFHNVSINSKRTNDYCFRRKNLHSIMYLLIHLTQSLKYVHSVYLHSIMYLLIHKRKGCRND